MIAKEVYCIAILPQLIMPLPLREDATPTNMRAVAATSSTWSAVGGRDPFSPPLTTGLAILAIIAKLLS